MGVEPLDPLAVAPVGLGPALDLAGEVGGGHHDLEAGLEEREEQHVAVGPAGLQRDGGDGARREPGDELTQPGGVGRPLADGVGAVGRGVDARPVGPLPHVDAGRVAVGDRDAGEVG